MTDADQLCPVCGVSPVNPRLECVPCGARVCSDCWDGERDCCADCAEEVPDD